MFIVDLMSERLELSEEGHFGAILRHDESGILAAWRSGQENGLDDADRKTILAAIALWPNVEWPHLRAKLQKEESIQIIVSDLISLRQVMLKRWHSGPDDDARLVTFNAALDALLLDWGRRTFSRLLKAEAVAELSEGLGRLADGASIGLCLWMPDGRITEANDAFLGLIGYSRDELEAGTIDWSVLTPGAFEPTDRPAVDEAGRGVGGVKEKEYVRRDGTRVFFLLASARLQLDSPKVVSLVVDRTEHKQREKFRERLLGIVGHDLRNPLTVIKSTVLVVLRDKELREKTRSHLERISRSAARMEGLIRSMLDFTQGALGGGLTVRPREMNVGQALRDMLDDVEFISPNRPVLLTLEGDVDGCWDPNRIVQAVGNLLTNALKYGAPDRPVQIEIVGEPTRVIIHVRNEGNPIPEELRNVIFEPFQQINGNHTGLGLGLYIVREVARAHHGEVECRSSAEDGTTFSLTLPRTNTTEKTVIPPLKIR